MDWTERPEAAVLLDSLEEPDPQDRLVRWDQLVQPDQLDLRVCRVLQVAMVSMERLDPQVRRVLKELLVRQDRLDPLERQVPLERLDLWEALEQLA